MMNQIAQAAQLACSDIYDPVTPGVFGKIYRVGETVCGTAMVDGVFYLVMQGTENWQGWRADFDIASFNHPVLGPLHSGFHGNLPALMSQLQLDIPPGAQIIVTGHSKGAGEGVLLGALLKLAGYEVTRMILFACPHAGHRQFADWLAANIPGLSYRNAPAGHAFLGDPVPMVPPSPYAPPYLLTYIDAPPAGEARLVDVEWHRGPLYISGFADI